MDWTLIILLFAGCLYLISQNSDLNLKEKQISLLFLAFKIVGGLAFYALYVFYYKVGDSLEFYQEGLIIEEALTNDFRSGLYLLGTASGSCKALTAIWTDQLIQRHFYDADVFSFIKMVGVLLYFGGSTYYQLSLVFALISFLICWLGIVEIKKTEKALSVNSLVLVLIIPSVLIWSSGVSKDNLTFSFGFLLVTLLYGAIKDGFKLRSILMVLFSTIMLVFLKPIFLLIIFVCFVLCVCLKRISCSLGSLLNIIFLFPLSLILLALGSYILVYIYNAEVFEIIHSALQWNQLGQGSSFDIKINAYDSIYIFKYALSALIVGLFRPFLWEVEGSMMFFQALENMFLMGFAFLLFLRNPCGVILKGFANNKAAWFLLFVGLTLLVGVGLSSFNFGALSRYRILGLVCVVASGLVSVHQASSKYRTI